MASQRPIFDPERMAVGQTRPAVPRQVSVTQLNAIIKRVIGDQLPSTLHLLGEISNFTRADSGHLYMTLKDDRSEIRAAMWRSAVGKLKFNPEDGMAVIATGHVDVYTVRGQYQFHIRKLEPRGVGSLELAFRQLQERLEAEGLFEDRHKKPLPRFPQRIAIITSPTGAAIRDIIQTLQRRFPCVTAMLHPARVQGEGAVEEIAAAIRRVNAQAKRLGGVDLMIVGRGGGSLEDLWAFNEEVVARAIFDSDIPIISGVGHEVDVTIADLVADLRAPTPTAAAELAVPVLDDLIHSIDQRQHRLAQTMRHRLELASSQLTAVERCDWFREPLAVLGRHEQRLDEAAARLALGWTRHLAAIRRRLHKIEVTLASINPQAFLNRQLTRLTRAEHHLRLAMGDRLHQAERAAERRGHDLRMTRLDTRVAAAGERLDRCEQDLDRTSTQQLAHARQTLDALHARLEATSHRQTLARGFSITRSKDDQRIVTRPDQASPGTEITTETADGTFASRVIKSDEASNEE